MRKSTKQTKRLDAVFWPLDCINATAEYKQVEENLSKSLCQCLNHHSGEMRQSRHKMTSFFETERDREWEREMEKWQRAVEMQICGGVCSSLLWKLWSQSVCEVLRLHHTVQTSQPCVGEKKISDAQTFLELPFHQPEIPLISNSHQTVWNRGISLSKNVKFHLGRSSFRRLNFWRLFEFHLDIQDIFFDFKGDVCHFFQC